MTQARSDRFVLAGDPVLESSTELADARSIVAGIDAESTEASMFRDRILDFIDQHADALHRCGVDGHLTGSALVVEAGTERILLLFHRKLQRWLQPGGHADGDANLAAVALREATEETGIAGLAIDPVPIDVDVHRVTPPGEASHDHLDVRYLVVAPEGSIPIGNHESDGLRWVEVEELAGLGVDPGTLRMVASGLDRLRPG